jgi:regulator of protease activity HflC (stomatin/prohibitin superfamily)
MDASTIDFMSLLTNPIIWIVLVTLYTLKKGIYFVPQNRGYVVYTLGKYSRTLGSGMNFILPYIQYVAADRNLKEQSLEITSQTAITKDNITLSIDGILFMKVVDAAAATNNITDYKTSVVQLAMTSMRNAIGAMELDDCFQNRDAINAKILTAMDEATSPWGIQVLRYEMMDLTPPHSIKEDMEKQMSAEREKRSVILTAEGVKLSEIARAEGHKEAVILTAQATKEQQVLAAEGEKEVQVLEATGEADAIRLVATAKAEALEAVGKIAGTKEGQRAVQFQLAQEAIVAHQAIASEGTIILSDGKTSESIGNTVAQALAVSTAITKKPE